MSRVHPLRSILVALLCLLLCCAIPLSALAASGQDADENAAEYDSASGTYANSWRYQDGLPFDSTSGIAFLSSSSLSTWTESNGVYTCTYNGKTMTVSDANQFGVDVSKHNGTISTSEWKQAKAAGVDFAIIRCGYGSNYTSQDDAQFINNVKGCQANGIEIGVYLYSYAYSTSMAKSEAAHVLRLLGEAGLDPEDLSFPVYYDLEEEYNGKPGIGSSHALSNALLANMAKTFCNVIEGAGYEAGVYANKNWWENYLTDSVFDNWSRWVAQYNTTCSYAGEKDLWQCMSTGYVAGIGQVDINFSYRATDESTIANSSIAYQVHVQSYGWRNYVGDQATAGTTGQSKRVEAIRIQLGGLAESGGVQYRTYLQSRGWESSWSSDGGTSGTTGQSRRVEAVQIKLAGDIANDYDIYYRVHVETYGWLDWAKNGETAGTDHMSKRVEAIQICLKKKGSSAPGSTDEPSISGLIGYKAHVQSVGWQAKKFNGATSGSTGKSRRIEAVTINLPTQLCSGSITYRLHVQGIGWESSWSSNGSTAGTTGQKRRAEAIQIELTGEMAEKYDVYYRVHSQSYGWLGWAKNGEKAGTTGLSKRMEAYQVVLVEKGGSAPGSTSDAFVSK